MEEYVSGADQRLHTQYEYDSNPKGGDAYDQLDAFMAVFAD